MRDGESSSQENGVVSSRAVWLETRFTQKKTTQGSQLARIGASQDATKPMCCPRKSNLRLVSAYVVKRPNGNGRAITKPTPGQANAVQAGRNVVKGLTVIVLSASQRIKMPPQTVQLTRFSFSLKSKLTWMSTTLTTPSSQMSSFRRGTSLTVRPWGNWPLLARPSLATLLVSTQTDFPQSHMPRTRETWAWWSRLKNTLIAQTLNFSIQQRQIDTDMAACLTLSSASGLTPVMSSLMAGRPTSSKSKRSQKSWLSSKLSWWLASISACQRRRIEYITFITGHKFNLMSNVMHL